MLNLAATVTVIWLGFFALAFVNGAIREVGIKNYIEEPWAHHLSALTAMTLFSIYLCLIWREAQITNSSTAVVVGIYWATLTVLAETFIVGRLISKATYKEIFAQYNIASGNLWLLVVLSIAVMPFIVLKLKT